MWTTYSSVELWNYVMANARGCVFRKILIIGSFNSLLSAKREKWYAPLKAKTKTEDQYKGFLHPL